jgi:hypothetical protein
MASGAILVAFVLDWFASIVAAFRHAHGFTGRARALQFFAPGSLTWAALVVLAVALLALGHRNDPPAARRADLGERLPIGLFLAACAVGLSASIDLLIELTSFGGGIDAAFSALIGYAAVLPIAAATAWWALQETGKRSAT